MIMLAGILLVLSGCGGGAEPAAAPSVAASQDPHTRNLKFAECLREQGLDVPDPEPGKGMTMKFGPGSDQQKVQQAMEACREWAPTGMTGGGAPDPKRDEQMRAYSQCMRDNGVASFPDPEGGMVRLDPSSGEDPDFEAAQEKCAALMQGPQ
jgi:hypothetical protein